MEKLLHPYIDGSIVQTQSTVDVINPATGTCVGVVGIVSQQLVENALLAAKKAAPLWAQTPISERVNWMLKLKKAIANDADNLRQCIHLEMGKPWASTEGDFNMLLDSLSFYSEQISKIQPEALIDEEGKFSHTLVREPIGVVGAFLAWNFPLLNLAYKLGPAMAAGCPIIIKPSIKTPLSAYRVGELCAQIGLPAGVVNIICGQDSLVGDAISTSPIPQMLTLIGATSTGIHVMRTGATSIKRYSMELGGNAPVLVFPDANLDDATDTICSLKFGNSGQICVAPNRVFTEKTITNALIEKVVARANSIRVGFNRETDIQMGPVIDAASWDRIDSLVKEAISEGAELLCGGGRPIGLEKGHFYAPTVLRGVTQSMKIAKQEVFGPVVCFMTPFDNESQVLQAANDTDAGLTAYIFTYDQNRINRCSSILQFGEIQINGFKYDVNLPHCGVKQSGLGVDCSVLALDEYLSYKRITSAIATRKDMQ